MSADSSKVAAQKHEPSQYAAVTWGPLRGLSMVAISFVGSQLIAALIILFIPMVLSMSDASAKSWLNTVPSQFGFVVLAELFGVGILWLFLRRKASILQAVGFTRLPRLRDVGFAILGALAYFAVFVLVAALASTFLNVSLDQEQETGFNDAVMPVHLVMAFVSLVILPPIVEEIAFRGVLYGGFRKRLPFIWAAVYTGLLFGFLHLFQSSSGLLWIGAIDTFVLSFVLCYLRDKTGSLWASIFVHMLKNGIAYLYLFIIR